MSIVRFISSATIFISTVTENARIFYSIDNSQWQNFSAVQGLTISKIGDTLISAYCSKQGLLDSDVVTKTITVMDRCIQPILTPSGGTFAGSVPVRLSSDTSGSVIFYSLNDPDPRKRVIRDGDIITINPGMTVVRAITAKPGLADSFVTIGNYYVVPMTAKPTISPSTDKFAISASLVVHCATPNATIYYTTDGSEPNHMSMTLADADPLVFEKFGAYTIKVMAFKPPMLQSEVATKTFVIMERALIPLISPVGGEYVGDLDVVIACEEGLHQAEIHYTTNAASTPKLSSPTLACGQRLTLAAPGHYLLRAFVSAADKSPSAVVEASFVLALSPYDELPVNPAALFQVQPLVEIFVVAKDFPRAGGGANAAQCEDRTVRGRLVVLSNPLGHFDIVEPFGGCGTALSLPSVTGQHFAPPIGRSTVKDKAPIASSSSSSSDVIVSSRNSSEVQAQQLGDANVDATVNDGVRHSVFRDDKQFGPDGATPAKLRRWAEEFAAASPLGCQVVTNAGFFNTSSHACIGDIVTAGRVVQTSALHNVNFGIRNGTFVVGYVDAEEVMDSSKPFDALVSGIAWLVRDGKSYVHESVLGGKEDMHSGQTTGSAFATVRSARTALGHDRDGKLLMLQVEGETGRRGMDLYEFAALAVEVGFHAAINLDGGGSATMTQNHSLLSEPSWRCSDGGLADPTGKGVYRCEKPVSTIACIHAAAPPVDLSVVLPSQNTGGDGKGGEIVVNEGGPDGPDASVPRSSDEGPSSGSQPSAYPSTAPLSPSLVPAVDVDEGSEDPKGSDHFTGDPGGGDSDAMTSAPSFRPSSAPSKYVWEYPSYFQDDYKSKTYPSRQWHDDYNSKVQQESDPSASDGGDRKTWAKWLTALFPPDNSTSIDDLHDSLTLYRSSSVILGALLAISFCVHMYYCLSPSSKRPFPDDEINIGNGGPVLGPVVGSASQRRAGAMMDDMIGMRVDLPGVNVRDMELVSPQQQQQQRSLPTQAPAPAPIAAAPPKTKGAKWSPNVPSPAAAAASSSSSSSTAGAAVGTEKSLEETIRSAFKLPTFSSKPAPATQKSKFHTDWQEKLATLDFDDYSEDEEQDVETAELCKRKPIRGKGKGRSEPTLRRAPGGDKKNWDSDDEDGDRPTNPFLR